MMFVVPNTIGWPAWAMTCWAPSTPAITANSPTLLLLLL